MDPLFPRFQQMASIALTIIGRIGHLAIGAIFTRACLDADREERESGTGEPKTLK